MIAAFRISKAAFDKAMEASQQPWREWTMDARIKPTVSPERAKFIELAQKGMNRAMKAIRMLGKLDRHVGWYIGVDVENMVVTLEAEIASARQRLVVAMAGDPDFRLGDEREG